MVCPHCRSENDDAAVNCFTCGAALVTLATIRKGSVVGSRYEILSTLGKGGMGMVFKAHDQVLDETVALKLLRADVAGEPSMARRFRQEIKLARKVRHKNVCGIHEYGEDGGLRYIAMEFVEGVDLRHVFQREGAPGPEEAFEISIQITEGLQAIHEAGIIHRDLKTANIMRDARGIVRLMDFGIAKQAGAEATLGATAVGMIVGTPEYMSPEQARGEKIDFRSDLYALGILIFEVFTGHVPFHGETPIATLFKQLQDPPPLEGPEASGLPASLLPVLRTLLAKNRDERYGTAQELVEALRVARAEAFPHAATGPTMTAVRRAATAPQLEPFPTPLPLTPQPTPVPTRVPTAVRTGVRPAAEPPTQHLETPRPVAPPPPPPGPSTAERQRLERERLERERLERERLERERVEHERAEARESAIRRDRQLEVERQQQRAVARQEAPPAPPPSARRAAPRPAPGGGLAILLVAAGVAALLAAGAIWVLLSPSPQKPEAAAPAQAGATGQATALAPAGSAETQKAGAGGPAQGTGTLAGGAPAKGPESSTKGPETSGAAAPSAGSGQLVIDALPWGEVVEIVDQGGKSQALGANRYTPLVMSLPPGEYNVSVTNPGAARPVSVTVSVRPERVETRLVEFRRIDARDYYKKLGF